jgi:hypothetical protein
VDLRRASTGLRILVDKQILSLHCIIEILVITTNLASPFWMAEVNSGGAGGTLQIACTLSRNVDLALK